MVYVLLLVVTTEELIIYGTHFINFHGMKTENNLRLRLYLQLWTLYCSSHRGRWHLTDTSRRCTSTIQGSDVLCVRKKKLFFIQKKRVLFHKNQGPWKHIHTSYSLNSFSAPQHLSSDLLHTQPFLFEYYTQCESISELGATWFPIKTVR